MRFSACAVQARAEALEGNLFKMCSRGSRITWYWIKYCRDYATSDALTKIRINTRLTLCCAKFNHADITDTGFSGTAEKAGEVRTRGNCTYRVQTLRLKWALTRHTLQVISLWKYLKSMNYKISQKVRFKWNLRSLSTLTTKDKFFTAEKTLIHKINIQITCKGCSRCPLQPLSPRMNILWTMTPP